MNCVLTVLVCITFSEEMLWNYSYSVCVWCSCFTKVLCCINNRCMLPHAQVSIFSSGNLLDQHPHPNPSVPFGLVLVRSQLHFNPLHTLHLRGRMWGLVEEEEGHWYCWRAGSSHFSLFLSKTVKYLFWVFYIFVCVCVSRLCFTAMHPALDTLSDSTSSTTANDLDLIFLKGIMESPVVMRSIFYNLWNI